MKGIKKYRTFEEARIDLYNDMIKEGFKSEFISEYFRKMKKTLEERGLVKERLYAPGLYFFESFEEAERDLNYRLREKFDNS